jgi:hypothetical protein
MVNGAIQTRGTCWFFSIINGFLLSDAGQKILFRSMEKFYKGLTDQEKAYFDDSIDAPCPLRGDIIKTKRIYFYKFLDQYLCFKTGPRSVSLKMGKSANVLGGASLAGSLAKAHGGSQGAYPGEEIHKILKHLGITDYTVADEFGHLPSHESKKRPPFVICKAPGRQIMSTLPKFRPGSYDKMCCSVTIGNSKASNGTEHKYHAITGFVCGGKGYLFDSNQRRSFPCQWWIPEKLKKVVDEDIAQHYSFFKNGQVDFLVYNYVIFSRQAYVNDIALSCRLKYKKTKTPNIHNSYFGRKNLANALNTEEFARFKFNPAQIAALKRKIARRATGPFLNKNFYNSLLETAKNRNSAMQIIRNMKNSGYRINPMDQHNFLVKLGEKFQPKNLFTDAKNQMKKATRKYERQAIYSRVWQVLPVHQRKVLAHFRDKGVLLPNKPTPIPVNSPRTTRRKNVESKFNNYWSKLTKNNRNTVRNYISRHKSPSPIKTKSPVFSNYLKSINALKTAKARAEWLKARKLNLKPENLKVLKQYVKNMNQVNRNKRDAKRVKS